MPTEHLAAPRRLARTTARRPWIVAVAIVVVIMAAIGTALALAADIGGDDEPTYDEIRAGDEGRWLGYADRDRVRDVAVGPDGRLWAATAAGVAQRRPDGWEMHTVEDGLPHQDVHAIEVADDGDVWIGTSDGIAAHDGDAWHLHHHEDALADEQVRALDIAPEGALWAAGTAGVTTYDGQGWTRHDDGAWDLAITADGTVWTVAQRQGRGVVRALEGDAWVEHDGHTDSGPLHDRYDQPFAVSPAAGEDEVWVGTRRGVSRFDGDRWHRIGLEDTAGVPLPEVTALLPADDGLWVATSARGVWRFADGTWLDASDGLPGSPDDEVAPKEPVTALTSDDDGGLWAGLGRSGIAQADANLHPPDADRGVANVWRIDRLSTGLPAAVDARTVLIDGDTVWIGTFDDGVWRHDGDAQGHDRDTWNSYDIGDGLPSAQVRTLARTDDAQVWAGTDDGIARFDGTAWSPVGPEGPADAVVHHLAPESGALWAATDDGLWHREAGTWTQHTAADGLPSDEVVAVAPADDDRVWAGTDAGLAVIDGADGWQQPDLEAGLDRLRITSVAVADATVWTATYDPATHHAAVIALDPEDATVVTFAEDDGFVGTIGGLCVDEGGGVWGVDDRGPSRYRDGRWTHHVVPSRAAPVWAAAEDEHGDLWVATRHGVGRLLIEP